MGRILYFECAPLRDLGLKSNSYLLKLVSLAIPCILILEKPILEIRDHIVDINLVYTQ